MTDLRLTIAPKSDQLNTDDLIGGPRTIKVTRVSLCKEPDQPIAIGFEGDGGKPYKPCKSMRRVLVSIWGADGAAYSGRSMTLYRDEKVQFGGMAVGGIRISHMSHIDGPVTLALTASRAKRVPFTVKHLADGGCADLCRLADDAAARGMDAYQAFWSGLTAAQKKPLLAGHDDRKSIAAAVVGAPEEGMEEDSQESISAIIAALLSCTTEADLAAAWGAVPQEIATLDDVRKAYDAKYDELTAAS